MGFEMTHDDEGRRWFLAQLKPNAVQIAERNLRRQGFDTFLPKAEITTQRNGRFATKLQPLFPGYIFVALDLAGGHWRTVNSTQGITRLVSFGKMPAGVPDEIMMLLIDNCETTGILTPPEAPQVGDTIKISSGPFSQFIAEVLEVRSDQRVWILLDVMGARTKVSVKTEQIQKP